MAKASNKVIDGEYKGCLVVGMKGAKDTIVSISTGMLKKPVILSSENVEAYELVTDQHVKSAASGVARGLVGGALLGPVGMIAGAVTAKEKGIYTVVIKFKDGKTSLLEVDDNIYNCIVAKLALCKYNG